MLLATKTYGAKTNGLFDTQREMIYALGRDGNPFPIKMLGSFDARFAVPEAVVALGPDLMWSVWLEDDPMPGTLIDDLVGKKDACGGDAGGDEV